MMMPVPVSKSWSDRVAAYKGKIAAAAEPMLDANCDMIDRAMRGMGPDKLTVDHALGARVVMNIASVHVPSFCAQNYKNTYDLGKTTVMGDLPPGSVVPARALVDAVLSALTGKSEKEIYFGAIELNGTGIRFYGDICLVLKADQISADTIILNSNSYDLMRPPITAAGKTPTQDDLAPHAADMHGLWGTDKHHIATLKVIVRLDPTERRFTTGQISKIVLNDEDYLEVLKIGSFTAAQLQEARLSVADAAAETQIGERELLGPTPSLAESQWRKHRRAAGAALGAANVTTRIVTTSGRVRQ